MQKSSSGYTDIVLVCFCGACACACIRLRLRQDSCTCTCTYRKLSTIVNFIRYLCRTQIKGRRAFNASPGRPEDTLKARVKLGAWYKSWKQISLSRKAFTTILHGIAIVGLLVIGGERVPGPGPAESADLHSGESGPISGTNTPTGTPTDSSSTPNQPSLYIHQKSHTKNSALKRAPCRVTLSHSTDNFRHVLSQCILLDML